MRQGQASVWLILGGCVVVFLACLVWVVSFGVSKAVEQETLRYSAITSCVQAGYTPDVCSRALRP